MIEFIDISHIARKINVVQQITAFSSICVFHCDSVSEVHNTPFSRM